MAHDVFISYSHKDVAVADAICHKFEENGLRCWYAPRDIQPGMEWADAIIQALENTRLMVLVFTDYSNASTQVHREVSTAISGGIPVIPFKLTAEEPSGSMKYFLSTLHWLDAMNAPMEQSIQLLLGQAQRLLAVPEEQQVPLVQPAAFEPAPAERKTRRLIIGIGAAAAAVILVLLILLLRKSAAEPAPEPSTPAATQTAAPDNPGSAEPTEAPAAEQPSTEPSALPEVSSDPQPEATPSADSPTGGMDGETAFPDPYTFDENNDSPHADEYLYDVASYYTDVYSQGVILERYFGEDVAVLEIPAVIDGMPVTIIGQKCFEGYENIEEVILPDTVEIIQYRAFYGLGKLCKMNIPASLYKILGWAFAHTGFVNVTFPETFTDLDYGVFYGCGDLETVVLSSAIDYIDENTFGMCPKLRSVTIPNPDIDIDIDGFDSYETTTLIAVEGSYAQTYAKALGLKFEPYKG